MIKGSIHQEDIKVICVPNTGAIQQSELTELKGKTGSNIVIVGDSSTSLSIIHQTEAQ